MEASVLGCSSEAAREQFSSARSVDELRRRPARQPDYASENRAFVSLAQTMAAYRDDILQKFADTALAMCRAHSAGVSLLSEDRRRFYWPAIAGHWTPHRGGSTLRDRDPFGRVLDLNAALVLSHPERDFPYFADVRPYLEDALLVPFRIDGGPVGTIWIVSHDESRRFDAEDLRVLTNLGAFAAAAYQNALSLRNAQQNASIVDSSIDAIASKNLDGIVMTWNRGAERLFGYTAAEIVGQPVTILIPPDSQNEERTILERIARGERIEHYETIRKRKDGSLVPVSLTVSPMRNRAGEIVGASKIARDISNQRRAEERVQLLLRELDHRSQNVLALVHATVRLAQGDTPDALRTTILGRLSALRNAHHLLAQADGVAADLKRLVELELLPHRLEGTSRAEILGPSLMLKPKSAQSVAMVLHELATNSVKYGSLSVTAGRVQVEWAHSSDGSVSIVWTESRGPPTIPPTRKGLGSRMIEHTVEGELNGTVSFDWRSEGLVCRLKLNPTPPEMADTIFVINKTRHEAEAT